MRHLISLADGTLQQEDFRALIRRGRALAEQPYPSRKVLDRKSVGLLFQHTSTRTKTSFAVAAVRLGAMPLIYAMHELQMATGETIQDTLGVLGRYLDLLVVRIADGSVDLRSLATTSTVPVINAMTADEHPSQALSDLTMIERHFGQLNGLKLLYCGEGNNTAIALTYAVCRTPGMEAVFHMPPGYGFPIEATRNAAALSSTYGGKVAISHEPPDQLSTTTADVVYTTRWQTTGTRKADPTWREHFLPFRVTPEIMTRSGNKGRTIFMHDLPANRGEECDSSVLDGSQSIALEQAEQKLFTAMAIMEWCVREA